LYKGGKNTVVWFYHALKEHRLPKLKLVKRVSVEEGWREEGDGCDTILCDFYLAWIKAAMLSGLVTGCNRMEWQRNGPFKPCKSIWNTCKS